MKYLLAIVVVLVLLSCEGGLEPPSLVEPGFGGTITFVRETWPPRDSLVNLWLIASQLYPLDSIKVFTGIFSNPPLIYIYPALDQNLPLFVDAASYSFPLPPAEYKYIAVIQHFKSDISAQALRVVGLYGSGSNPQQPLAVTVRDFEFVNDINITVNFYKLPPQPF